MSLNIAEFRNSLPLPVSIELQSKQVVSGLALNELIPTETRVYLVDLGNEPHDQIVGAARIIRDAGLEPVPHIAARRVTSQADLSVRLQALSEEAGVRDVLVIGGGLDQPAGPFDASIDVFQSGLLDRFGIRYAGIAGHPEGSPDFNDKDAQAALLSKQDWARRTDCEMRIVTQFGFAPKKFSEWADGLSDQGIDLPVHLGIAGPAKTATLIKYAIACGVGNSLDFLKRKSALLTGLVGQTDPSEIVSTIEAHVKANPSSAIRQLHFFPFGGLKQTSSWLTSNGYWQFEGKTTSHEPPRGGSFAIGDASQDGPNQTKLR